MAFQVSPGVQVKEIDATGVIPAVSTSIGGFVGAFKWGPAEEIRLVSSEDNMASVFSTPDSATAQYFLTAASFLKYGNALKVIRAIDYTASTGSNNASAGGDVSLLIRNEEHYETAKANLSNNDHGQWAARYPGALGNSIRVEVCFAGTAYSGWSYKGEFDETPGTSEYAKDLGYDGVTQVGGDSAKPLAADELHVLVIDRLGHITGTPGAILERWPFLSQASDAKDSSGNSLYYPNVINAGSEYIFFASHNPNTTDAGSTLLDVDGAFDTTDAVAVSTFTAGRDGSVALSDITGMYHLFLDSETVDVNLLFSVPDTDKAAATNGNNLLSICESRKDCMAFISPPTNTKNGNVLANVLEYAGRLNSSSYGTCDSGPVYVYDKYNDEYLFIGSAGLTAGLCANTDQVADTWFSPAGVNRGQLRGVTKLAFNPTKAQRDELYKARVNPIVSFPGQGTMLFGDKTLLSRPSAFDRINVRRLFIVLEKAIATAAKAQLFEFNDEFTRAQFRNMIEPFLRDVKGRRGMTDFLVICDETNNTGQVIDSNRFVADIFIKPARSINFITLNFIATRTGVDFSEVAGG